MTDLTGCALYTERHYGWNVEADERAIDSTTIQPCFVVETSSGLERLVTWFGKGSDRRDGVERA